MYKCGKCFFCIIRKLSLGGGMSDYGYECCKNLDGDPIQLTEEELQEVQENGCKWYGDIDKAKELFEEQEEYNWKEFDNDKRTAHYKTTKDFREKGADKYLTLYTWSEFKYFMNNPIYEFWHEKALVHYKDGSFKLCKFRSIQNGKCGSEM